MEPEQIGLFDKPRAATPSRLLRDPAIAAAVARCCIKQLEPNTGISHQIHPMECRWCRYPLDRKLEAVREFTQWAGFATMPVAEEEGWSNLEPTVEAFMQLPREEQARLTTLASGYAPNEWGEPDAPRMEAEYAARQKRLDTGYEYPQGKRSSPEVMGTQKEVMGSDESVTDDQKRPSATSVAGPSGPMGGWTGPGERRGRGLGGPEAPTGAARRGLPDRTPQASGPEQGDLPVQDRFHNPDGTEQPF